MTYTVEELNAFVRSVFLIDDITIGTNDDPFIVRYRGKLTADSAAAYDKLEIELRPLSVTPLFREEGTQQAVFLVASKPEPKPFRWSINLIMFILTFLSVLAAGIMYVSPTGFPTSLSEFWSALVSGGIPFGISMLAILGTHEFGHYIAGRLHGVHVSLPYFIPMPFSSLGTMGAFINMRDQPKNRRDLLDIGLAGPLAGLVVSIIVLAIGLKLSRLDVLPTQFPKGMGTQIEGNSVLYLLMKYFTFRKWLPLPATYSLPPILHWVRYFFTGTPAPLGATDVMLSPVAWAGWAGLLVTSLNLIPAGQLDGGHLFYTLFGKEKAKKLIPAILVFLALLGFVWSGWWLWALIVLMMGRVYAEPRDQITELDPKRKALAVLGLVIFLFTFTPIPLAIIS
jgi:membrane-associated protease RseP (regulator of RpoE activity)